jgi:hypothetical protein
VRLSPAYVVVTIESAAGVSIAAPSPCARPTSASGDGARPLASDASVKNEPGETHSAPPEQIARPAAEYQQPAREQHLRGDHRLQIPNATSCGIDGSATVTTVMSSVTINCARPSRTSVVHGFRPERPFIASAGWSEASVSQLLGRRVLDYLDTPGG